MRAGADGVDTHPGYRRAILRTLSLTVVLSYGVLCYAFAVLVKPAGQLAARELEIQRIDSTLRRAEELTTDAAAALEAVA
jgi:hypothetical protein